MEIIDYDKFVTNKEVENPVSEKFYSPLENKITPCLLLKVAQTLLL